ncbi:hypothetical protein [Thermus filiformis]|jgi:hypothetical protein|uniref:hypothetical protein n=1 Tax=Thermus filiformis TaxID=276 RepID=UPI000B14C9CE|nr:hypothetical protein [Thermus filiformis]
MERLFAHKRPLLLSFAFGALLLALLARVLGQGRVFAWALGLAAGLFLLALAVE